MASEKKSDQAKPAVDAITAGNATASPLVIPLGEDTVPKHSAKSDSSLAGKPVAQFVEIPAGEANVPVPNVQSKLSDKEQAKLQAQIGNLQKTNETKENKVLATAVRETDLKKVPTIYIKNCTDSEYKLAQRTTKILIEGCKDTIIHLDGDILTRTVEMWKCHNVTLKVNTQVKTLQLDLSEKVNLQYSSKDNFGAIVWAHVEDCNIEFHDEKSSNVVTGFKHMLEEHPDSVKEVDQFIIRFLEGKLTPERCVRLKNGFLSTEREATEWEKRNETKKAEYLEAFLKNAGVHLNKSNKVKVAPNEPCPCGSTKKHKKCCMHKASLTGVEQDKKAVI